MALSSETEPVLSHLYVCRSHIYRPAQCGWWCFHRVSDGHCHMCNVDPGTGQGIWGGKPSYKLSCYGFVSTCLVLISTCPCALIVATLLFCAYWKLPYQVMVMHAWLFQERHAFSIAAHPNRLMITVLFSLERTVRIRWEWFARSMCRYSITWEH